MSHERHCEARRTPPCKPAIRGASADKQIYSEAETQRYYAAVGTSATGDGLSIAAALPTLSAFRKRYFDDVPEACRSEGPELVTKYFNQGDLGLGREMHCLWNTCNDERVCYVANYGRRDGSALFNNKAESFEALKANKPFATVAMVERGRMPLDADNRVFFVVYDHQKNPVNPPLTFRAPLDNKEFNTFIPGNCLVCHGSGGSYDREPKAHVRDAFFLPFDLSAFAFYSAVPTDPLSRFAQENNFKLLNRLVFFTALGAVNADANELISGWYGGSFFGPGFFQDYKEQSCACLTRECLDALEGNFIGEFATMTSAHPSHAGAIETLRSEAVECHLKVLRP